ncbi:MULTISPECIES: TolC family protein [Helicobacter]|uniref:TolC family protein n=13 Tax=Helicobacter typhlonius TaxID=76936 RepID=A0A0S4PX19_9HELI|nr:MULTISPECIES: TolC family protein [Helicobacter]TLD78842.1 TolC family protein [Helicobacter typhlonius]TLD90175.1 TolC family protein [Helicobacter sp. MIT 03-1616]CUU40840.1 FIG00713179: Hypothetical protein [Helicobacter typhlonius]
MKKWIFLMIFAYAHAEYLSLESAYNQVLAQNDGLKSSQSALQKQEKLRSATKMIYLPQISLNASYIHLNEQMHLPFFDTSALPPLLAGLKPVALQDQNIVFGVLNIMYPLFTGGKRYFANKLSQIALEDATLALKLKELSLFEDCTKLYYGAVLAQQILNTLEEANAGHLAHYQNAQKLQEKGQIARLETLQAQVNYDKSNIEVQKARDNLDIAYIALNAMLGRNGTGALNLVKNIDIKQEAWLEKVDYFVNKTFEVYPALRMIDNKKKGADELSRIEFSSFLPDVGLFGSYMVTDNTSLFEKALPNWYVGVGARWSLLSPNGRIQKYQASKIASLEAQYALTQAQKDLKTLCEKTYNEVLSYKTQYFSLSSSIELASENLKLRKSAFVQGLSTSTEVSDAQNALSLAIIERQSVAYNYVIALSRLFALSDEIERFYGFFNKVGEME